MAMLLLRAFSKWPFSLINALHEGVLIRRDLAAEIHIFSLSSSSRLRNDTPSLVTYDGAASVGHLSLCLFAP